MFRFDVNELYLKIFHPIEHLHKEHIHRRRFNGYKVFGHISNDDEIFERLQKTRRKNKDMVVKVLLGNKSNPEKDMIKLTKFKSDHCPMYYDRYFKELAKTAPIVLPQEVPNEIKDTVESLENWCSETNKSFSPKGLVLHSFSLWKYLKWLYYGYKEKTLLKDLQCKDFPLTPALIVYNPRENVILLIRKTLQENFEKELELCSVDMKMFLLIFGDELENSGIKVIPMLASNNEVPRKLSCDTCKNFIVSGKQIQSYGSFKDLWDKISSRFKIENTGDVDKNKVKIVLTKFIGFLAAAQFFDHIPTFTDSSKEQMEHILVILTPTQKRILDCNDKHVLIKGPYGSGKSIIACKKMQMLAENLKKDETVYFICYDSKSALAEVMENRFKLNSNANVFPNKEGKKLSEIIKEIQSKNKTNNSHLIIDEYDGDDLDIIEAQTLNNYFEEDFKNAHVFLICQSMEKKRIINDISQARNMFSLLKTMKPFDFKLVMRNSLEINDLVLVTQRFLEEEKTIYQQQQQRKLIPPGTSHTGKLALPKTSLISKNKNPQKVLSNYCSESSSKIIPKEEIHGQLSIWTR